MRTLDLYITGALAVVVVYLLVNGRNTNTILGTLGQVNTGAIKALQGR